MRAALDLTIQKQILDLLDSLQRENGMGLLVIAHDLAVMKHIADQEPLMRARRIDEQGTKGMC